MELKQQKIVSEGKKFFIEKDGKEVARAYIYLIKNDLREKPYALLEDVFVDEKLRGQGIGSELLKEVVKEVKSLGCYKFIATSRYSRENVHKLYEKLEFVDHGKEFRMDFDK